MKVLILGINYSPEPIGTGRYTGDMARWFAQFDNVRVITAVPYYPAWKFSYGYKNGYQKNNEDNVLIFRCPIYVPQKPTTVSRILHLVSFGISAALPLLRCIFWRPEVIIQIAPTIVPAPLVLITAKLTGATAILHIQDFEVDAMFGLSGRKETRIEALLKSIEYTFLKRFNLVSTISASMCERAIRKGCEVDNTYLLPNWADDLNNSISVENQSRVVRGLGLHDQDKCVLYSGNLGEKQGLELILHISRYFLAQSNIKFLIVGEGPAWDTLHTIRREKNCENVMILPLQPDETFKALLARADCHLVLQKSGIEDAVLPSKLTNIFAAGGNTVITATESTGLAKLCQNNPGLAQRVDPGDELAVVAAIKICLSLPRHNEVAKDYAAKHLEKNHLLTGFRRRIEALRYSG